MPIMMNEMQCKWKRELTILNIEMTETGLSIDLQIEEMVKERKKEW